MTKWTLNVERKKNKLRSHEKEYSLSLEQKKCITDFLPFSLLPFVTLLFGQASQSNACDKFHKAGAKEMLSLFAEKAFWGKAQTMWRRLEQNALPCDRQTVWTKADCSLQWPGIFGFGWDRVWLRPECHSGILFRLYTPFKPGNHSPLSRMK